MTLAQFAERAHLTDKTEVEKVVFIAYFFLQTKSQRDISLKDVADWFRDLHFGQPNFSRLAGKLKGRDFVAGERPHLLRLHAKRVNKLRSELAWLDAKHEEVISSDSVLPVPVFSGTRGYIENLAKQINAAYEHNIFDGCAVLMRRLLEVLLIHSFIHSGQESIIRNAATGQTSDLSTIIGHAIPNPKLGLSKGTRDCMDKFRTLGNFSAHRIEYTCRKGDLEKVLLDYRACVEELLYKGGLR